MSTTPTSEDKLRKLIVNTAWEIKLLHNSYDVSIIEDDKALHAAIEKEIDAHMAALSACIQREVSRALIEARAKDPFKCEHGHEVYSHKTVDGWCCACEADQTFMEGQIEDAVRAALIAENENWFLRARSIKSNSIYAASFHDRNYGLSTSDHAAIDQFFNRRLTPPPSKEASDHE